VTKINKVGTINSAAQMKDAIEGAKRDGYHKAIVHTVPNPKWPGQGERMVPFVNNYWLVEIDTTLPGWPDVVKYRFIYCGTEETFRRWCYELEQKADEVLSNQDARKVAAELEEAAPVVKEKTFVM